MGEHLEHKLTELKAKLEDLRRQLPLDNIPLSMLLEIETLEREIHFLSSNLFPDETGEETYH